MAHPRNRGHGFKKAPQGGNIRLELLPLLVEEQVLRGERDGVRALRYLPADVLENVRQRDALAAAQCHRTELAAAAAPTSDLDHAEGGTVQPVRNPFQLRTLAFHPPGQRFAPNSGIEEIFHHVFRFPVDDTIDAPLVLKILVLDLPCARTAENDFQVMAPASNRGMLNQPPELVGIDRLTGFAI